MRLFMATTFAISIALTPLSADLWKIDTGAGAWDSAATGTITSTVNETLYFKDDLSAHESVQNGYFYLSVKHPLPILPNLRLEYTDVSTSGNSTEVGTRSTSLPQNITIAASAVKSSLSMTQYDTVLFYNLLDETLGMTVDMGLDLKYLMTDYRVDGVYESSDSTMIPLVYLRGRYDLPRTGLGVEGDIKYITDGSSTVYDLRLKVDYVLEFLPVLHPGVELGYRLQQFTSDGEESSLVGPILSGDTDTDIGFSGVYGGLTVKF